MKMIDDAKTVAILGAATAAGTPKEMKIIQLAEMLVAACRIFIPRGS